MVEALSLGVAAGIAVTVLSQTGALFGWETRVADAFLFIRDRRASHDIVMVTIDEEAFRELGERQPLSRRYLAELTGLLLESGARVVAFDIQLRTPTNDEEDRALVNATGRWAAWSQGQLVFASEAVAVEGTKDGARQQYKMARLFTSLPGMVGFANAPIDARGMIRTMTPVLPASSGVLPSFALATVAAYGPTRLDRLTSPRDHQTLILPAFDHQRRVAHAEEVDVAALANATWRIDFVGPPGSVTSFSAAPLVRLARSGVRPAFDNPFRDRIVLVGATFRESRDFYLTPVGFMAGVEIHANMVHTLLSRRVLLPPPLFLNLIVIFAVCGTVALASVWLSPPFASGVAALCVAGVATLSYEAYTRGGYWLDFVAPVFGVVAYLQGARVLTRRRLRQAFGEFVNPEILRRVLAEGAALGGEVRTVSVVMSDLRGFTAMAERRAPLEVSETINEYLTAMVDIIIAHRGMVQDFVGDGILAVFGAPAEDPDHAMQAVETALAMHRALSNLNERWRAVGRPSLGMGTAVHTGSVFAGYVGSPKKKKYAVLGDTVNTVSRLEGLNRELGTSILISGAVEVVVRERVRVRARGVVGVKGREEPVHVFELLGKTPAGV